jgi:serine/threonine kinase 32
MVLQLIDKDPSTRLGCRPNGQGFEDVQAHPWFAGIDWSRLDSKECQPPFVPDVSVIKQSCATHLYS